MINPQVQALHYKVVTAEGVDYKQAPALIEETENFRMSINDKSAIFNMKKRFSTPEAARAVVEEYLKQWDVLIGIEHWPDVLQLQFKKADIIDLEPAQYSKNTHGTVSIKMDNLSITLKGHTSYPKYPELPNNFSLSPDVESMYVRYSIPPRS